MSASDSNSPFNDPSFSRERLELETRVLAAALRQSLEIGDTEGSSLAHEQIFLLLKASQELVIDEPINLPSEVFIDRGRALPDIDWGSSGDKEPETTGAIEQIQQIEQRQPAPQMQQAHQAKQLPEDDFAPPLEAAEQMAPAVAVDMAETAASVPEVVVSLAREEAGDQAGKVVTVDAEEAGESGDQVTNGPSDVSPNVSAEALVDTASPLTIEQPAAKSTSEEKSNDYYDQLKVTALADFPSIHLAFWRTLRVLLRKEIGLVGPERLPHLKRIQRLWIAHDILCDPVTRADYDFRRMGLRGGEEEEGAKFAHRGSGPRTQLRIGELLQCAGLLEQTELDIAADMHKAMPEMMFGAFLVKQGFIEEADLDCVLVGQQLLKSGDITVVQFQTVMIERSATGLDIGEMLLAKGYVNQSLLDKAYRNQSEDTLVRVPTVAAPGQKTTIEAKLSGHHQTLEPEAPVVPGVPAEQPAQAELIDAHVVAQTALVVESASAKANMVSERTFNFANAAPAWKDQLDWSSPEPEQSDGNVTTTESAAATSAEQSQEVVDGVDINQTQSRSSALDVVLPEQAQFVSGEAPEVTLPGGSEDVSESVRTIAQIWAEESKFDRTEPDRIPASAQEPIAALIETAPAVTVPEDLPDATEVDDQSALPDEIVSTSALETIAQVSIEDPATTATVTADKDQFGAQAQEDLTDNPFVVPEEDSSPASAVNGLSAGVSSGASPKLPSTRVSSPAPSLSAIDETFSEIETSSQLPSLGELELQARSKESQQNEIEKSGTGDWQIMSVPGSALTSLFLDDEPETTAKGPTMPTEVTDNTNVFIDNSYEDQFQTGPRNVQKIEPAAPTNDVVLPLTSKDAKLPPDGGPKKTKRRRNRH